MPERSPIFSEEVLTRFRATLTSSLGSAEFWESVSPIRLRVLMATVMSPEFASSVFADEIAAVRAWAHDAPSSIDAQSLYQLTSLFCQLVGDEQQRQEIPVVRGLGDFLEKLDQEILPARLAAMEDQMPLTVVLRGLSGTGKSSLADVMRRAGFRGQPRVGLLSCDIYHCKVGRDRESKRAIYRTEDGRAIAIDPIFSEDPIQDAKSLLWFGEFRRDFARLAEECAVIVLDGGYGELLLDEMGVLASQRMLIELWLPSGRRFERVAERANRFQTPAAARVKIMNDTVMSIAWHSLMMESNSDPDWLVVPDAGESSEQLLTHRCELLERQPLPRDDADRLLQQLNIAREPGTAAMSAAELDGYLSQISAQQINSEQIVQQNVVEIHRQLPGDLQSQISIPQFQRILSYCCNQMPRR